VLPKRGKKGEREGVREKRGGRRRENLIVKSKSASDRAFQGVCGDFFVTDLPEKKRCFNTQEFTRALSTGVVTASSHAL